jgi:ribosomal-protein-alanine N-acetyltransferase
MILDEYLTDNIVRLETLDPETISPNYLQWLSDPLVNQYLEIRHNVPESVSALREFVRSVNASDNTLMLGIFSIRDNLHIGNIKVGPIDWIHRRADIGFLIGDKQYWGKGIATASIMLLINYCILNLGLKKLTAGCYEPNVGSYKALEKSGFVMEGKLRSHSEYLGDRVNVVLFGYCDDFVS